MDNLATPPPPSGPRQRLIVGLGNPGKQYERTRHNIGFDAIDRFARVHAMPFGVVSRGAQVAEGRIGDTRLTLLKPMTYMNLSGEPLTTFLRNRPHDISEIIVVVDDIHIPLGKIRIRPSGSEGGHNGLKSVAAHLHTRDYSRIRIGVSEPNDTAHQIDYVLSRFSKSEEKELDEVLDRVVSALDLWIDSGTEAAMNRFNGG